MLPEVKKAEKGANAQTTQIFVLATFPAGIERVMGLEPTTATLATWRSTTELHPHEK
jgi:hypothetical protein